VTWAFRVGVYRSPWWLLVFVVAGLVGATIAYAVLQGRVDLPWLLLFYISWTLGVIIVWIVTRRISSISK